MIFPSLFETDLYPPQISMSTWKWKETRYSSLPQKKKIPTPSEVRVLQQQERDKERQELIALCAKYLYGMKGSSVEIPFPSNTSKEAKEEVIKLLKKDWAVKEIEIGIEVSFP